MNIKKRDVLLVFLQNISSKINVFRPARINITLQLILIYAKAVHILVKHVLSLPHHAHLVYKVIYYHQIKLVLMTVLLIIMKIIQIWFVRNVILNVMNVMDLPHIVYHAC